VIVSGAGSPRVGRIWLLSGSKPANEPDIVQGKMTVDHKQTQAFIVPTTMPVRSESVCTDSQPITKRYRTGLPLDIE